MWKIKKFSVAVLTLISGMEIRFVGSFSSSLSRMLLASGDMGTSEGYSTGLFCMMSYRSTTFLAENGTYGNEWQHG